ncbi:MAG TPA: OB-fold nucleic acid binding domain-containing protein, partial [Candidatus Methylomirabilis sp.]|nr:OB-fold nucleic acid binding domain-containing protein [Candidatus Methylomirabilis sp.]
MKRQGISSGPHAPNLSMPVQYLKGVGPKRAQALARLGVRTVADAFYLLPLRHEDRRVLRPIRDLRAGLRETVAGEVKKTTVTSTRRGFKILSVVLADGTGMLVGKWFHQPYLKQRFHPGHRVILSGKVSWGPGLEMVNPDYEPWEDGGQTHTGCIVPVYPLADGLFQRWLRSFMKDFILAWGPHVQDFLPHGILHRHSLMALPEALRAIHFPEQMEDAEAGKRRLAFDDLLLLSLGVARMRLAAEADVAAAMAGAPGIETAVRARLGFDLTPAQERVLEEIKADMARPRP